MFEFKMNNVTWTIYEVSQEIFWQDDNELDKMNNKEYYMGRTKFDTNVIWLWEDANEKQKRKTLIHELLHCYRGSYVTFNSMSGDEDFWCDMCANSHDIIHNIVERYFDSKPKSAISKNVKIELYNQKEKTNEYEVKA